jgi:two-component system catabolic regulation response regulator CreB
MPRQVLIVEDEVAIADTLLFALGSEGFEARRVTLAREALELLRQEPIDLVILDVGLPDMTGFEACKQLRRFSNVPVMFLTARAEEVDRVVGLEIGADDYVVKPFSPREIVARVRAILKRSTGAATAAAQGSEFFVDGERLQIHYQGQLLKLTALEFRLLQQLLAQPEHGAGVPAAAAAAGPA